ncbi:MAG: hypothetical protein MUO76_06540, partial [Anaerolineaceae bacterium]|nr:hypothetical protein [Anaerolineaceae bacterium]
MIDALFTSLREIPVYKRLLKDIQVGLPLTGLGLPRATRLFVLAALYNDLKLPLLFVTDRSDRAVKILDEIQFWLPNAEFRIFPEPNPLFYEFASWGARTRRDRLQILTSLADYHLPESSKRDNPVGLIAPVRAIMTRTLPRRDFIRTSRVIRISTKISPEKLLRSWVDIGYQYNEIVVGHGQFSKRGGILDIWPPGETSPIRFEFFGTEIDTIRTFDPATQRTIQNLERVLLTPAREILPGQAVGLDSEGKDLDEFYLPLVHPAKSSLLDYLPQDSLIMIDDFDNIQIAADEIEYQAVKFRRESINEGLLAEDFPIPYTSWSELHDQISGMGTVELGSHAIEDKSDMAELFTPGQRFAGRLKHFIDHVSEINVKGEEIYIVSRQIARLKELWKGRYDISQNNSRPTFIDGTLSDGWILSRPDGVRLNLITDSEIFGWERPKPRQRRRPEVDAPEKAYADLIVHDWVVHMDYGIGRYEGLVNRTVDGAEREFLQVEYDAGDRLYVPIHQADRLSRYIGTSSNHPRLTRLGTTQWNSIKSRVRESVREIAWDLLDLYAKRKQAVGFAFSPDTTWQKDLESAFPYIET